MSWFCLDCKKQKDTKKWNQCLNDQMLVRGMVIGNIRWRWLASFYKVLQARWDSWTSKQNTDCLPLTWVRFLGDDHGYALELHDNILRQRATKYSNENHTIGSSLPWCIGYVGCTKIGIQRPGGYGILQRSAFYRHERFQYLIYQIHNKPNGFTFALYGSWMKRLYVFGMNKTKQRIFNRFIRSVRTSVEEK